ncbi:MAG: hypothetical protein MMC23_006282 [Stictis urceolatum]|nr:hypothetical protein [Stictis urceolata]
MPQTAIKSVLLFDGHTTHPNTTVLFSSTTGTITSIDPFSTPFPPSTTIIDGSGHTLIPGLIEGHMHVDGIQPPPSYDPIQILKTPLKCGITTLCDMHSDPAVIQQRRAAIADEVSRARAAGASGRVALTDLKSSLFGATIAGGWPRQIVLSEGETEELKAAVAKWPDVKPETAEEYVQSQVELGADYIKIMQEDCCSLAMPTNSIPVPTLELQARIVEAAHKKGFLVVGHAISAGTTSVVLQAGADGLAHTFVDQALPQEVLDLYKKTGAFVVPTLTALASLTGEEQGVRDKFADIAHKKGLIDDWTREVQKGFAGMRAETATVEHAYTTIRKLREEGVDVVAGTDAVAGFKGTAVGPSLWMELSMYVEKCGMSAVDALRSATSAAAKRFRFEDRGTVEVGKRADLVLVRGNVTEDIEALWEGDGIVGVWKQGIQAAA